MRIEPRFESTSLSDCLAMAHKKNPKDHDIDKLVESFARFGFRAYPTIDEASATMVAGHGRCQALAKMRSEGKPPPLGVEERGTEWWLPVIRGLSFDNDDERDAYVIADNQHVMAGGWHFDTLSEILGGLRSRDALAGLGFDDVEMESLLGNYVPDPNGDPGPSDAPPPEGFVRHDITVATSYCCPKCGYEWSGKPK